MEHPQGKGLLPLPYDGRDYSHHKRFGTLGASQLTFDDFTVYDSFIYTIKWGDTFSSIAKKFGNTISELSTANPKILNINKIYVGQKITIPAREKRILNQWDLDFCVSYVTSELQYLMFGIPVDPLYQMAKIKQSRGEYTQAGADLRDGARSVTRFGSLPSSLSPYTHSFPPSQTDKTRNFLANWVNWPVGLDMQAAKQKDLSYFTVDGTNDAFDNIRSTLKLHQQERRAVSIGLFFCGEWTYTPGGIIPNVMPYHLDNPHNMAIVGQKTISGIPHLIFQNTWGDEFGDKGFYYFPRAIVNQIAQQGYGMLMFSRFDKSGLFSSIMDLVMSSFNKLVGNI